MEIEKAALLAIHEYEGARGKFPWFQSAHEGFAILYEEVDELWEAVREQHGPTREEHLKKEAIQVAAMALAFLVEVAYREE